MLEETTTDARPEPGAPSAARRGRTGVYAVAFGLMLGAGVALAASSLGSLRSMGLLWLSAALSVAATLTAVAGVILPRRS